MRHVSLALAVVILFAAGRTAGAHDFWAEPATHAPKAGEALEIRLRVGDHFAGEEFPRSNGHCLRFEVLGPGEPLIVEGKDQEAPAGRVTPKAAGLHWIVYRSRDSETRVQPAIFARYLEEEGLTSHVAQWKALDPDGKAPMHEAFSRCAKTLLNVGGGAMGRDAQAAGFDRVAGLKLEIVPEVNPLSMKPGDDLPVLLKWDGKPLADHQVSALAAADPKNPVKARTDADGRARAEARPRGRLAAQVRPPRTRGRRRARPLPQHVDLAHLRPAVPAPRAPRRRPGDLCHPRALRPTDLARQAPDVREQAAQGHSADVRREREGLGARVQDVDPFQSKVRQGMTDRRGHAGRIGPLDLVPQAVRAVHGEQIELGSFLRAPEVIRLPGRADPLAGLFQREPLPRCAAFGMTREARCCARSPAGSAGAPSPQCRPSETSLAACPGSRAMAAIRGARTSH